ncbi:MAG: hypothetical protein P4L91_11995 [Burkholderiaceae bacterium]|nr:hypothetical protein [Burkholderiaceae bacterium]
MQKPGLVGEALRRLFLFALLLSDTSHSASVLDFDIWMRKIDTRIVDVQRKLDSRDDAEALAQAREIEDLYAKMEAYFVAKGESADAIKLSRESKELAGVIAKSVTTKNYQAGGNAAVTIARACTDCHDLYRPF